jgi:hypothetical protein
MHIGSEEDTPLVEFVVVKKENLQEQQPEEDEQVLEWLWSTFVSINFSKGKPQSILSLLLFLLKYT